MDAEKSASEPNLRNQIMMTIGTGIACHTCKTEVRSSRGNPLECRLQGRVGLAHRTVWSQILSSCLTQITQIQGKINDSMSCCELLMPCAHAQVYTDRYEGGPGA